MNLTYTDSEIHEIAKRQKTVVWLILVFVSFELLDLILPLGPWIVLAVLATRAVVARQYAVSLKESSPWLYTVAGLIPFIGLLAFGVLNSRATRILRARGLRVGVTGVSPKVMASLIADSVPPPRAASAVPPPIPFATLPSPAPEIPPSTADIQEFGWRLVRLDRLFQHGDITEDEYQSKRRDILAQL
jgi:hypothetical protein